MKSDSIHTGKSLVKATIKTPTNDTEKNQTKKKFETAGKKLFCSVSALIEFGMVFFSLFFQMFFAVVFVVTDTHNDDDKTTYFSFFSFS